MCKSIDVYIYIHTCFPIEHNILLLDTNCVIYYYLLLFIKIYTKFNKYCALYKILTIHFAIKYLLDINQTNYYVQNRLVKNLLFI